MFRYTAACAAVALWCATLAHGEMAHGEMAHGDTRPDSHAPIGVMGDHLHKQGEWMVSYRHMRMRMAGNRDGTSSRSPTEIAASEPNAFGPPPTLRVVPTEMDMEMHMLGAMYGLTNNVTLMAMTHYARNEMDHITFAGPTGTTVRGGFTTKTSGFGDTQLAGLIRLGDTAAHAGWHATVGVSLPTGDVEETDAILTPMGTRPSPRLPYPMQLGSGSYDLITGLTYQTHRPKWSWGGQWRSTWRLLDNDEDYRLGDEHKLSGWVSRTLYPSLSVSLRLEFHHRGNLDGSDALIRAPVQTADPDRQAFDRVAANLGLNWLVPNSDHRLALELGAPVWQRLDGPQLETDWQLTAGWQLAF